MRSLVVYNTSILREWPKRQLDKNSETIGNIKHTHIYTMQHSGYGSDKLRLLPMLTNSMPDIFYLVSCNIPSSVYVTRSISRFFTYIL
jgi:hypothetical protein